MHTRQTPPPVTPSMEGICLALEHANIPCCYVDRGGVIVHVNATWEKVYCLRGKQRSLFECISSEHRDLIALLAREKFQDRERVEIRWHVPQGVPRWFTWQLLHEPEHDLFFIVAQEITSLKMTQNELTFAKNQTESSLEQLEQSMKLKSMFLSNISHEIRTPLNGILGMITLLKETKLDEQQRDYLKIMARSGSTMAEIINDVLDLSQLEARKMELLAQDIDLREMIEELVVMAASTTRSRSLELSWNVDRRLPPIVKVDGVRLRQILNNLINNAVKFTEYGEVNINVNVLHQRDDLLQVQIDVQDTGIGIEPERLLHIFEPFTQVVSAKRLDTSGTGLGLAICKQLIDAMGGELTVESAPGEGSTFSFILPLRSSDQPHDSRPFFDLEKYGCDHVVVLTQHPTRSQMIVEFFGMWQVEVQAFFTVEPLLDLLQSTNTRAMIFLDVQDISLAQFTYHLQDPSIVSSLVPLIAMSDSPDPYLMHDLVDDALSMPLRQASLTRILQNHYPRNVFKEHLETRTIKLHLPQEQGWSEAEELYAPPMQPSSHPPVEFDFPTLQEPERSEQLRVLVAEDHPVNQIITSKLLESFGYAVDVYPDGLETCEAFYDHYYDAILMDCQMPVLDGYSATMRIREYEASLNMKRTPIIGLSAHAFAEERARAIEVGMDDYLTKPVDRELLRQTLEKWLTPQKVVEPSHARAELPAINAFNPLYFAETPLLHPQRQQQLLESCDRDVEFIEELIDTYEQSTRELLSHLGQIALAWEEQASPAQIKHAAHSMKGSSDSIGLRRMTSCVAHLERHALHITEEEFVSYLEHIDMVFELSLHALSLSEMLLSQH